MPDTQKKIALITGGNKGIGFEVARQLGKSGCTVLIGCRDKARGDEAVSELGKEGIDARNLAIDLLDHETSAAAAGIISADYGRLDILVNNAGIYLPGDGAASQSTLAAVEQTLGTNFLGTVAVTQAMLPLLRKAPSARIVNVSSGLGSITLNSDPDWEYAPYKALGYGCSKAALNMFTVHLAYELRDTPIKVNSADPGYTATDLNHNSGPQTVAEGAEETVRLALLPNDGPTGIFSNSEGLLPWYPVRPWHEAGLRATFPITPSPKRYASRNLLTTYSGMSYVRWFRGGAWCQKKWPSAYRYLFNLTLVLSSRRIVSMKISDHLSHIRSVLRGVLKSSRTSIGQFLRVPVRVHIAVLV